MWYNGIMLWLFQSPLHGMHSSNVMVINYTGRKSGKAYRLPISYKKIERILLTLSYKHRTWWRNLRGGTPVTVHLQGKEVNGRAEVIEDDMGVTGGLKAFIAGNPHAVRMVRVNVEADGQPELESLKQAARERVVVRTALI